MIVAAVLAQMREQRIFRVIFIELGHMDQIVKAQEIGVVIEYGLGLLMLQLSQPPDGAGKSSTQPLALSAERSRRPAMARCRITHSRPHAR